MLVGEVWPMAKILSPRSLFLIFLRHPGGHASLFMHWMIRRFPITLPPEAMHASTTLVSEITSTKVLDTAHTRLTAAMVVSVAIITKTVAVAKDEGGGGVVCGTRHTFETLQQRRRSQTFVNEKKNALSVVVVGVLLLLFSFFLKPLNARPHDPTTHTTPPKTHRSLPWV
jgi:hypothetical protein